MKEENRLWYAVQGNKADAWDCGSYDYQEAVTMLAEQGYGLIAVINDYTGTCLEEVEYKDLF